MTFAQIIFAVCSIIVFCFGLVVFFGAPFLPTLKPKVKLALDLAELKEGQTLLELGSGDGRVLIEAAKRGIKSIGYELNPLLVMYSRWKTRKYRRQIKVKWGNFWKVRLPKCDAIFVFLLNPYMDKLDKKITLEQAGKVRLVSFAFELPNKKPSIAKDGLFMYEYNLES